MHLRSLERFAFDSVLFPYNFTMMNIAEYAAEAEALLKTCNERGVAVQTIKSVARRRWQNGDGPKFSWYEPLRDRDPLRRAVHFVLSRPGLFLNSSSDATLLHDILDAGARRGITAFRADVLADNRRMLGLLDRHTEIVRQTTEQGVTELVLRPRPRIAAQTA